MILVKYNDNFNDWFLLCIEINREYMVTDCVNLNELYTLFMIRFEFEMEEVSRTPSEMLFFPLEYFFVGETIEKLVR